MALFASTAFAQDDMYFTPRKKTAEEKAKEAKMKEMREAYVPAATDVECVVKNMVADISLAHLLHFSFLRFLLSGFLARGEVHIILCKCC